MNDVFFRPWVGSAYSSGGIFGKQVMILGRVITAKKDARTAVMQGCIQSAAPLRMAW